MMNNCIFCKIAHKEISTDLYYESDDVIAFADIKPIAPVHILIVPKMHIASMNDVDCTYSDVIAEMFVTAVQLAKSQNIAESGYKLLIRTGSDGGQEVPHIHLHLIGGAPLAEDIQPR